MIHTCIRMVLPAHIAAICSIVAAAPIASGKPLISDSSTPPTPYATLLDCDEDEQNYVLWTLQSSTSGSDELEQRYETQLLEKGDGSRSSDWGTINKTEWRDIPRQSRAVISQTKVNVANAEGKEVRELVHFRWTFKHKGKIATRQVTRATKDLQQPEQGSASCNF